MNPRQQLIYLAFGAEIYQREAIFSIVSSLSRCSDRNWDIRVFTDTPRLYTDLPVTTAPIEAHWSGPNRYHFRIKHAVLRHVLREHRTAVLVDTDTFFHDSPGKLFERIQPGQLLCNTIGSPLIDSDHPKTFKAALLGKNLLDSSLLQTNSGVMGLHSNDAHILEQSISLMDELHTEARDIYSFEEICLAVSAHGRLRLSECPDLLHHYWSRKSQFRAKISAWYEKHQSAPLSEAALGDIRNVTVHLPRPPQPLRGLHKIATLALPAEQRQFARESLYGCYRYPNEFDRACTTVWWEKALENAERRKGHRFNAHSLNRWLNHPVLRTLAGSFHHDLTQHLCKLRSQGSIP